jgi:DNA-directed RNA polymerase I, II, and III subunit RPABC2
MSDSEENPKNIHNLNNIFINSKINSSKGIQKIINNTPQNLYINKTLNGGKKIESETNSDSENSSQEDDEEDEEDDNNENNDKENEGDEGEEEEDNEENEEEETQNEKSEEVEDANNQETEYNEDGANEKDTELKDDITNDCLYQYDDLIEAKDIYKQPTEVPIENRTTDPYITHYEKIRILGIRAKQISMGAKEMVKYDGTMSAIELAKHELQKKTTPLIIKRILPNNTYELWKVSE